MSDDTNLQVHFTVEKGRRDSDRIVQDCLDGLVPLLHHKFVQVDGKLYQMVVVAQEGKIMFDIRDLPGFDHVEFVIKKTGWGLKIEGEA